jgi:hypothetical protein
MNVDYCIFVTVLTSLIHFVPILFAVILDTILFGKLIIHNVQ